MQKQHIISVTVENRFGVLARISGLFAGRGYNISSLAVNHTDNNEVSIIILQATGEDRIIEQVMKQLNRLIDVIKVVDLSEIDHIERELMLIKVQAQGAKRHEIFQLTEVFRCSVVDVTQKNITLQIAGNIKKIDAFIDVLRPYGIKEVVRSGPIAISRGNKV